MADRYYSAWCPGCGAEWPALPADDSSLKAGEVVALVACEDCLSLTSEVVRQPSRELEKLRLQMMKAVQKICQSYVQAHTRLKERQKALAREVHRGNTEQVDLLREVEARLASLKPPDTSHLEKRADQLRAALADAPARAPVVNCRECSERAKVFRESHHGFEVPCPRCAHKLMVKLKTRR